ncbi:MAG: type II toxin-antitoxin system Phd/YefM family antitoxin [Bacillota bacterium]
MSVTTMKKQPTFTREQLVPASVASKQFGELRKKAKILPQFITDNGNIETVVIGYEYFEKMYQRLIELEEQEEAMILTKRIEQLEKNPALAIPWKSIRRTGRISEKPNKMEG